MLGDTSYAVRASNNSTEIVRCAATRSQFWQQRNVRHPSRHLPFSSPKRESTSSADVATRTNIKNRLTNAAILGPWCRVKLDPSDFDQVSQRAVLFPPADSKSSSVAMEERPPINKRPQMRKSSLGATIRNTGMSTRHIYEMQVKTANYEAMMQRFQLRKVSDMGLASSKFEAENLVIDKENGASRRNRDTNRSGSRCSG